MAASTDNKKEVMTFWRALLLPRVFLYAMSLFCMKLAVNSMLLWLPLFLQAVFKATIQQTANISTIFDSGAILGSVALGHFSDFTYHKRSPVAFFAVITSFSIAYGITFTYEIMPFSGFCVLLFFFGVFESALVNIIAASCAADLGRNKALLNNKKAACTVAGIIDGSGNLGSAIGQLIISYTVPLYGW